MANNFYDAFRQEQFGDAAGPGHGAVDFEADTLKVLLVDSADYTVALATDQDHADVTAGGIVATSGALSGKAITIATNQATFDHTDVTWSAVSGDQSELVVYYKDSGASATSLLICVFDTFASGMPVTPNGGDIVLQVNASGVFTV